MLVFLVYVGNVSRYTTQLRLVFFVVVVVVVFRNVSIKPILMGFTQSHCQTAVQTTVLDRFVFKLRQRSSVLVPWGVVGCRGVISSTAEK